MKMHDECIPCLVSQVIKTAHLTGAEDRETLYKQVFAYMAQLDFNKTNPEVAGDTYAMLKKHIGNDDPYKEVRAYFNDLILQLLPEVRTNIETAADPFLAALQYASAANIIDFSPAHSGELVTTEKVMDLLSTATTLPFVIDHTHKLKADLVISKGQANYETLSDRRDQNIYFMLITKCQVIADDIGVPERSLVCLNHPFKYNSSWVNSPNDDIIQKPKRKCFL